MNAHFLLRALCVFGMFVGFVRSLCIKADDTTWVKFEKREADNSPRVTCALKISAHDDCTKGKLVFLDHYLDQGDYDSYFPEGPYDDDDLFSYTEYDPDLFYRYSMEYAYAYHLDGKEASFDTCYARCTRLVRPRLSCDGKLAAKLEYDSVETEWTCDQVKESRKVQKRRTFFQSRFGSKTAVLERRLVDESDIIDCSENSIVTLCGRTYDPNITLRIRSLECSSVPTKIGLLKKLRLLDLKFSRISVRGKLPTQLGKLVGLTSLRLSIENSYPLPTEIGALINLKRFVVGFKNGGRIQTEIGNLVSLTELSTGLFYSKLTGSLPSEIGKLTRLEVLNLAHHALEGQLPTELGNLDKLHTIDLTGNKLVGRIPGALVHGFRRIRLSGNKLTYLPTEVGNFAGPLLQLTYNKISGSLPSEIGRLKATQIDLAANEIIGQIPREIFNVQRVTLNLAGNKITGLPQDVPGDIQGSFLHLGTMTSFTPKASIRRNQISGQLPSWLSRMKGVIVLDGNLLSGRIPSELGEIRKRLDLSQNQLTGPVPTQLGNLKDGDDRAKLDLSDNRLSGNLPTELGRLRAGLLLSRNRLTGRVPTQLGKLREIEYGTLDLSRNKLTGRVPSELGDTQSGWELLLNRNCLTGQLPSELARLSDVELDLSRNKLTGILPEGLPEALDYSASEIKSKLLNGNRIRTRKPTKAPRVEATKSPQPSPQAKQTSYPTSYPTKYPTKYPTVSPTQYPTSYPTRFPRAFSTPYPTAYPTVYPTPFPKA